METEDQGVTSVMVTETDVSLTSESSRFVHFWWRQLQDALQQEGVLGMEADVTDTGGMAARVAETTRDKREWSITQHSAGLEEWRPIGRRGSRTWLPRARRCDSGPRGRKHVPDEDNREASGGGGKR